MKHGKTAPIPEATLTPQQRDGILLALWQPRRSSEAPKLSARDRALLDALRGHPQGLSRKDYYSALSKGTFPNENAFRRHLAAHKERLGIEMLADKPKDKNTKYRLKST
jgi:hypothetical protein